MVNNGLIRTDNYGQWNSALNLTVNGSGQFEMWNNESVTLATLSGSGTVQNTKYWGRTQTLTVAAGSFSGTITDLAITSGGPGTGDTRINLVKNTAGTLTLSGTNSYGGTTTASAGKLVINGNNSAATGTITVAAGTVTGTPVATLAGSGTGSNGTIGGNVSLAAESSSGFKNGGVLAPTAAASGTKLSVAGTTTFGTGSIFEWDLNASTSDTGTTNQGNYGQLAGTGAISGSNAVFKSCSD